jgi:hypothetical protein
MPEEKGGGPAVVNGGGGCGGGVPWCGVWTRRGAGSWIFEEADQGVDFCCFPLVHDGIALCAMRHLIA